MYKLERHKAEVRAEVNRLGLCPLMNDTRWRRLQAAIDSLPFPPPYQRKDVLRAEPDSPDLDADVSYQGNYTDECLGPFFATEWIRIRPRYLKQVGRLLPPVLVDCEAELLQALREYGLRHERDGDTIVIHGYKPTASAG